MALPYPPFPFPPLPLLGQGQQLGALLGPLVGLPGLAVGAEPALVGRGVVGVDVGTCVGIRVGTGVGALVGVQIPGTVAYCLKHWRTCGMFSK